MIGWPEKPYMEEERGFSSSEIKRYPFLFLWRGRVYKRAEGILPPGEPEC